MTICPYNIPKNITKDAKFYNSYADAIDIDIDNIKLQNINILNAKNDVLILWRGCRNQNAVIIGRIRQFP